MVLALRRRHHPGRECGLPGGAHPHALEAPQEGPVRAAAVALLLDVSVHKSAIGEHRRLRARAIVTCSPPLVLSDLHRRSARPGLDFATIRRMGPRLEPPSDCVVGPVNPSNPGVLGLEKHHVAFDFAGGRNAESVRGRRTSVEPSIIANGDYNRAVVSVDLAAANFAARPSDIVSADLAGRSSAIAWTYFNAGTFEAFFGSHMFVNSSVYCSIYSCCRQ